MRWVWSQRPGDNTGEHRSCAADKTEVFQLYLVRHASQEVRAARSMCWAGSAGGVARRRGEVHFLLSRASTAPALPASPVHRDGVLRLHWSPGKTRLSEGV